MFHRSRHTHTLLPLIVQVLLAGTAHAQQAPASSNASTASTPDPSSTTAIVVSGRYQFLSANTEGATNLPLPIEQVPQSINLVSGDFIKAANLKTLGDIASYTAGAFNAGNPTNNGTVIDIRGFPAGRAIDGINAISSYNSFEPDFAIFDRLEIVEGPSSVVYGIASPGGLVNYVTKSAKADTPSYLYAQGGSWNGFRIEGQFAHTLDADGHVRVLLLAAHDQGDSFTKDLFHRNTVVYGAINADITDTLTGYIHAGYEYHVRPAFDGIPAEADGAPAPVPYALFIGAKDITLNTSVYYTTTDFTWKPSSVIELNLKGNYENALISGGSSYGYGLQSDGTLNFSVNQYAGVQSRNYGIGASSIIHLDTIGLKDSFISIATLYQNSHQYTNVLYPNNDGTVNIFQGQQQIEQAFDSLYSTLTNPALASSYASGIDTTTWTISAQSVTKFFDRLTLLLGASYAKPKVSTNEAGYEQYFAFAGQVSLRGGLTYEFLPHADAYISYSESFDPQALLEVNGAVLPPISGKQYEAGIKYRPRSGILLTGAVYRIVERNVGAYDQTINGIDFYKPVGEVTHKGFELKALGKITQAWQINAGFAYLDPKVTNDVDPTIVGQTQIYLPKNTFSAFTTYRLGHGTLTGLSAGGGVRYVASVKTAYDGSTIPIRDYTLVDLNLSYDTGPWLFQAVLQNALDKHYFINNYQTLYYGNMPGTPSSFSVSVKRTF